MHPEIIERTYAAIAQMGGTVWRDPKTDLLHVNRELVVCVLLTRCYTALTGVRRWHVRFDPAKFAPDITIDGMPCLSLGVAVTYVAGTFTEPTSGAN